MFGKKKKCPPTGVGKCPMTWEYWTSPYSSHYRPLIPNGWVMWKMRTWLMTHAQGPPPHGFGSWCCAACSLLPMPRANPGDWLCVMMYITSTYKFSWPWIYVCIFICVYYHIYIHIIYILYFIFYIIYFILYIIYYISYIIYDILYIIHYTLYIIHYILYIIYYILYIIYYISYIIYHISYHIIHIYISKQINMHKIPMNHMPNNFRRTSSLGAPA